MHLGLIKGNKSVIGHHTCVLGHHTCVLTFQQKATYAQLNFIFSKWELPSVTLLRHTQWPNHLEWVKFK